MVHGTHRRMIDNLYFWIFNNIKSHRLRFNLMGMIAFLKSGIKHYKRGNDWWMIRSQIHGFFMCLKQIFIWEDYQQN